MSFWAALLALAWDRLAPLFRPSQLERLYCRFADWAHDHFNAGSRGHGLLAWSAAALLPALVAGLLGGWLERLAWPLGLAWSAAVLYRCLGFQQMVDLAHDLAADLAAGEDERARGQLAALGLDCGPQDEPGEWVRPAMERLFHLGLERLFGVLFWFFLLGAFGAVAYALTRLLAERWQGDDDFHAAVAEVLPLLDWLPARLLVVSFALVGNFEEAMLAWRSHAAEPGPDHEGVVRVAGQAALGLGDEAPGPEYVAGMVGLLNRAVLLWLGVAGLFWLGGL